MTITGEKELEIVSDYKKGIEWSIISERHQMSRQQMYLLVKKHNLPMRKQLIKRVCPNCNKEFSTQRKHPRIFCNRKCYIEGQLGNRQSSYHYSKRQLERISIRQWQRRARAVVILSGHDLKKGNIVHHIDGDIKNLKPLNLFIFHNHSLHLAYHHEVIKGSKRLPISIIEGLYCNPIDYDIFA